MIDDHNPPRFFRVWGPILFLSVYSLFAWIGYLLAKAFIARFLSSASDAFSHVLSSIIGITLLFCIVGIIVHIGDKRRKGDHDALHELKEALQEISEGNFTVILEANDMHLHKELADAINSMAQSLGTMEKMREDFISNASHEIQSPLTSIKGFAMLIQNEGLSLEERKHYARIIESESTRLSSLSDSLLKLSTLDSQKAPLNKSKYSLDKQLRDIALVLEPQWAQKPVALEADLEKCLYYGDESLLSQAFINIINNAIKFTPENGSVTISLKNVNGGAEVSVQDTGIGISKEDQMRVFERFYKADKSRDRKVAGSGLGLSIAKKIVELHSGALTVESSLGKGSEFKIFLPSLPAAIEP